MAVIRSVSTVIDSDIPATHRRPSRRHQIGSALSVTAAQEILLGCLSQTPAVCVWSQAGWSRQVFTTALLADKSQLIPLSIINGIHVTVSEMLLNDLVIYVYLFRSPYL